MRLACFGQDGHTRWPDTDLCDIINCVAISERKVLSPYFKENEDAESFERNCQCVYMPSLEYGNEQSFSFTDIWTKQDKTVNRLEKDT